MFGSLVSRVVTGAICCTTALADYPIVSTSNDERNHDLACSDLGNTCLVAISSGGLSMVRHVTESGPPLGSLVFPWGGGVPVYQTAIGAGAGTYLLVTWDSGVTPWPPYPTPRGPSFMAVLVNSNGIPLTMAVPVISGSPYGSEDAPYMDVAYNSLAGEYLVTAQVASGSGGEILGRRVSQAGAPLGTAFNLSGSASTFHSHAVAYAPVTSTETPQGRYLLVWDSPRIYMLDSLGVPMYMLYDGYGNPQDRNIPFEWGSTPGGVWHPQVAYGEWLNGSEYVKTFLVAWADYNNADPHQQYGTEWTGIWGGHVDAELLQYTTPPQQNSTFPLSFICTHWANPPADLWLPRVAFDSAAGRFAVVWRETSADNPCNDTRVTHIRGTTVDYLYRYPPHNNTVLSRATGTYPGVEQPLHPAVASTLRGVLVTWDDDRHSAGGTARDVYAQAWALPPDNDACAAAEQVGLGDTTGTLVGATNDGETNCGLTGSPDVWYRYTAYCTGTLQVSTCGTHDLFGEDTGIDTVLALHTGCPGSSGNTLICNDDWSGSICATADAGLQRDSGLTYGVAAGQTVWIRVSRYDPLSAPGDFMLHLSLAAASPANDACMDASALEGNTSSAFCTRGATTDGPDEPGMCNFWDYTQVGSDIWYCWTSLCTGTAVASLCSGADYDTKMAVYAGCQCRSLSAPIACNDDACGTASQVAFSASIGHQYLIRIGGYGGAQGGGVLSMECTPGITDCNQNGIDDSVDIANGNSQDCDSNGIPDECQPDEDNDLVPDACDDCPGTVPGSPVDTAGCPPEIPGDFNRDGDVDIEDYATFVSCVSGPGVPLQPTPPCPEADLHADGDVDGDDFGYWQRCFSGPNHAGNPACLN